MPAYFNQVTIAGNLTRDTEIKEVGAKSTPVVNCTVAVNDGWGDNEKTYFIDVTLWGKQAVFANDYLSKGSNVLVTGKLQQDSWEDDNGNKRSKIFVNAFHIQGLGGRKQDSDSKPQDKPQEQPQFDNVF
tara:strand:+ start:139 stop:528 length:390 start_codon:yes stop_codon:yes gene_type:complete